MSVDVGGRTVVAQRECPIPIETPSRSLFSKTFSSSAIRPARLTERISSPWITPTPTES